MKIALCALVLLFVGVAQAQYPVGTWTGKVFIVPYTYNSGAYKCLSTCSVGAFSTFTWQSNSLIINVTATSSGTGCSVDAQSFVIHNIVVHGRYPYYGGTLYLPTQTIPVCFAFDNSGGFAVTLDGQGTCPNFPATAACIQSGQNVIQVFAGNVKPIPSGLYRGTVSILPYGTSGSGYQCLSQCTAITTTSAVYFSGSTIRMDISAGRSPQGCTLNAQTYYLSYVTGLGTNYFGAMVAVGSQSVPVCFYFVPSGAFVLLIDGQGTCPPPSAPASCVAGGSPGTVIQTWTGHFSASSAEAALTHVTE